MSTPSTPVETVVTPNYRTPTSTGPEFKFRRKGIEAMSLHYGMFERGMLENVDPKGAILGVVDLGQHGKMYGEWYDPSEGPQLDVALAATGMGEEQAARYLAMHENQSSFQFSKMGSRMVFQNHTENWGSKGLGMSYSYDVDAIVPSHEVAKVFGQPASSLSAFKTPFFMAVANGSAADYLVAAENEGFEVVVVSEEDYAALGGGVISPGEAIPAAASTLAAAAYEDAKVAAIVFPPSASPERPWLRFVPLRAVVETDAGRTEVSHLIEFDGRSSPYYNASGKQVALPSSYTDSYAPQPSHELYERVEALRALVPHLEAAGFQPTGHVGTGSSRLANGASSLSVMQDQVKRKKHAGGPKSAISADGVRPGYGAVAIGSSVIEIAPLSGDDGDSLAITKVDDSPRADKYVVIKLSSAFHSGNSLGSDAPTNIQAFLGGSIVRTHRSNDGFHTHTLVKGAVVAGTAGLGGLVFKPFLGGLGPIECSFLVTDSLVTFELVGTQANLYASSQFASRPRQAGELNTYGELVNESPGIGFRDIIWCEVKLNIIKTWTRVGLEGLDFLASGAGVIKPFPEKVQASYRALGEELDGEYFSMVDLEKPWPVPSQPVTRLEVYNRYRKAKEKACKKNDFLDQPYSEGRTWGQAQRELEKRGNLGSCYMVGWKTALADSPELKLPTKVILIEATSTSAAYAEVDWGKGEGPERVKPGDYDKVGYWLKSGVPYVGPLSVVRQGAGLDVDFDPNLDQTSADNDFWGTPNSVGWGVGAATGTVFAPEAYSQSGFADLSTMTGEAPIKAALASVNLFGHTGAQLSLVFKKVRKDVPAAVMSRGRKIALTGR